MFQYLFLSLVFINNMFIIVVIKTSDGLLHFDTKC